MSVLVIGNFGYVNNQLDGQTIKTRTIYKSVSELEGKFSFYDVGNKNKLISMMLIFIMSFKYKDIYFLPGIRQLIFVSPLLFFVRMLKRSRIHYIVVGGWVTSLNSKYIKTILGLFDSISVELPSMVKPLKVINPKTYVLENYRITDVSSRDLGVVKNQNLRLVYFSRVMKEKGIFDAINVSISLENTGVHHSLIIHGPICFLSEDDATKFNELVDSHNHIKYKGTLSPDDIKKSLEEYHVLLFPTSYEGEGYPGCIVDAKMAGLTIFCTDWKYNGEIVNNGVDGYVIPSEKYVNKTTDILTELHANRDELLKLMHFSHISSSRYAEDAFLTWRDTIR
ncbi:glycosyltransferase [Vibrio splendidus]|uniref:glycosyltransferase n=1 Tax=Vibrio splendidus TaxID=29497 RepID=UPI000D386E2C|nr:glycosyltransferase [Vibrio splendidus]PTP48079.1 hypothetical protein CWO05_23195 [Vibrio splendidus]